MKKDYFNCELCIRNKVCDVVCEPVFNILSNQWKEVQNLNTLMNQLSLVENPHSAVRQMCAFMIMNEERKGVSI